MDYYQAAPLDLMFPYSYNDKTMKKKALPRPTSAITSQKRNAAKISFDTQLNDDNFVCVSRENRAKSTLSIES